MLGYGWGDDDGFFESETHRRETREKRKKMVIPKGYEFPSSYTVVTEQVITFNNVGNDDNEGFLGGAQIGYNWQFTPGTGFVVGVEADIQGIDFNREHRTDATYTVTTTTGGTAITEATFIPVRHRESSLDWFGTLRGRAGWAFDRLLVYATGGLAFGNGDDGTRCPTGFDSIYCRGDDETR